MRMILVLPVLALTAVAGTWLGGETLLARRAAEVVASDPRIEAAAIAPLRRIDRIGLQLQGVAVQTPEGVAELPELSLWAEPARPNRFHATLPAAMILPIGGAPRETKTEDAGLSLRISPLNAMSITEMAAVSGPVTVAGAPAAERISLQAEMVKLGHEAPPGARAAYRVTADLRGLTAAAVQPALVVLPGAAGVQGAMRVYLDRPLRAGAEQEQPQIEGLGIEGVTVTLGDLSARLLGHLRRDESGFAEGQLYLYTRDAQAWLEMAAAAGALPAGVVPLAGTMLANLADQPSEAPSGETAAPEEPPAPEAGELRLPVVMQDGRMSVGGLPVGPAPRLG